jgi:rhodanese-related sulfurtransferase
MKQLFILFMTVTAFAACNAQSDGVKNLSQQDLATKLQDESVVLIDVRTSTEVASGYIPEAEYFIDINGADFEQKIAELDTTKTYVIYCRSGARSGRAASYMSQNGFTEVYNLEGGILNYPGKLKQ